LGGSVDPETGNITPGTQSFGGYMRGYFDIPADEQYIDEQLDLLQVTAFDFYTDECLAQLLPPKVFLVDSIYYHQGNYPSGPQRYVEQVWANNDFIAITWGAERILSMTSDQKKAFKNEINNLLLLTAKNRGMVVMPQAFADVSAAHYSWMDQMGPYGVIIPYRNDPSLDWDDYIRWITSTTDAERNTEGGQGFLHESFDTNGLVRQKYDIVIAYLTSLGIDIEAISEASY
jgi:hypothetical protein